MSPSHPTLNPHLSNLTDYPFDRLRALLDPITPPADCPPLALSIGEPQSPPPDFVQAVLNEHAHLWGKYPPIEGTPEFRAAVHDWMVGHYGIQPGLLDPDTQILPCNGTREALYLAVQLCAGGRPDAERPVVVLPNPFYHVYSGAAWMAPAEPVYLDATRDTGYLPDLDQLDESTLKRTAFMFLCSPANPQGAAADLTYLTRALELARAYGFVLGVDECYAELYTNQKPAGALQAAEALGGGLANLMIFHSLSKRSNAAGMRCGFISGDKTILQAFKKHRSFAGATVPLPIQAAAVALYRDIDHVAAIRDGYRRKFVLAERILAGRFGHRTPDGGFFLWLDVENGEEAAKKLWGEAGIRVLPGAYLGRDREDGTNAASTYIRVALVHDISTTEAALTKLVKVL